MNDEPRQVLDGLVIGPIPDHPDKGPVIELKRASTNLARKHRASDQSTEAKRRRKESVGRARAINAPRADKFAEASNEDLADTIVRQAALQILYGDELMTPTTLNEATKTAASWAAIAKSETLRRRAIAASKLGDDLDDDRMSDEEDRSQAIARVMAKLRESHRKAM